MSGPTDAHAPTSPADPGEARTQTRPEPPAEARAVHLLIVDDEPVILQILRAVFEEGAYRLSCVGTGSDALRVLEEQTVDVVITDKNLPDMSGLDVLKRAKELDPLVQVIVVTGYASLDTAISAVELDAFDYLLKPLNNVFDIQKKVERALDKRRLAQENRLLLVELRRRNEELQAALDDARELQGELIQSEKLAGIGTLAAGIAHEISSPLFGIMGLAEAIGDEQDAGLVREYADDIVEYCRSIRDIVVELSSYSRAAEHEFLGRISLARVMEDARRLVERSAPVEHVHFDWQVPAELEVQARSGEIQQVFVNLLKNAAEAVAEGSGSGRRGTVRVRGGLEGDQVWATVSDDGVGIPEEKLSVIFDPFYTTKPPGKGTGLGLNVVYRILTKYRGTVQVESTLGEGTTFTLRLPAPS